MKKLLQQSCNSFLARNSQLLITFLFLFLTCIVKAQTVTITTDQDDYYPGEWVIISGTGWTPGDSVKLSITHIGDNIPNHTHAPWTLTADANGNISDQWYVAEMELNTTLWLQAQSLSTLSMYAEKVFTDAINWTLNLQNNRQSASNYCASTIDNLIHSFIINVSNPNGQQHSLDLTGIRVTIGGTWNANDVTSFKLYYTDKSSTFVINELLAIIQNPVPGIQYFTFNTPSTFITTGNYYFWITADISAEAVNGHTIIGNSLTKSSITSTSTLGNGTAIVSSAKTIVALPTGTLTVTENSGTAINDNIINIGDNISFTATEGFLNYNFKINGSSVQTGPTNAFSCTSLIDDASVTVEVTNSSGCSSIFGPALIKVNKTPAFTNQPLEQHINYGMNVNFTVTLNNNGPFTYKWQIKTGSEAFIDIMDGGIYSNSTTATLMLTKPTVGMTGCLYRCIVSNSYGSIMSDAASLIVDSRPITITADAQNKIYGDTDPALSARVTNGSVVPGDAVFGSLSRPSGENVGSYAINKGTYTYGSNYNETFVGANLVIGQRPVTITPDAGLTKVYGTPDPVFTYTPNEALISGNSFSGALGRTAGENVADGPYAYNLGTLSAGSNYSLTLGGSNTFAITKAPSATVVSISGAPFTYTGSAIMPASVSVTGAGGLNLNPDPVYADNINAGTATASYSYAGDANHEPSIDSETFTIGKAA